MTHDPSSFEFTFDPLREADLPLLRDWLQRPHVARWWGPAESLEELRESYIVDADKPGATRAYIAKTGGEPIGFIQCYVVVGSGGGWWEDRSVRFQRAQSPPEVSRSARSSATWRTSASTSM